MIPDPTPRSDPIDLEKHAPNGARGRGRGGHGEVSHRTGQRRATRTARRPHTLMTRAARAGMQHGNPGQLVAVEPLLQQLHRRVTPRQRIGCGSAQLPRPRRCGDAACAQRAHVQLMHGAQFSCSVAGACWSEQAPPAPHCRARPSSQPLRRAPARRLSLRRMAANPQLPQATYSQNRHRQPHHALKVYRHA